MITGRYWGAFSGRTTIETTILFITEKRRFDDDSRVLKTSDYTMFSGHLRESCAADVPRQRREE